MANFVKRSKLPAPPSIEEASDNLRAPEHAPAEVAPYVDGRTLRATGRTQQFSTRVSETFHHEFKMYAVKHKTKLNVLLEEAFAALKRERRH